MPRDPRFDILFEPVPIGPVTAPNRFYQVPHFPTASLWDDDDVPALAMTVDRVHEHGALAGVELWAGGAGSKNFYSREVPLGPWSIPAGVRDPVQTKAMDKQDIRELKRWHREAAIRAKEAGFDIVYVYAAHWYLILQFLLPSNQRTDEYGGSLENRARLLKELIIETKEAVGDTCAVAVRFSASIRGPDHDQDTAEPREVIELLGELPDLWDITVRDYTLEMGSSRFVPEAALEAITPSRWDPHGSCRKPRWKRSCRG